MSHGTTAGCPLFAAHDKSLTGAMVAAAATVGIALACLSGAAEAQIYVGTSSESGALVLSSFAIHEGDAVLIPAPGGQSRPVATVVAEDTTSRGGNADIQRRVDRIAARSSISPGLLHAVIA